MGDLWTRVLSLSTVGYNRSRQLGKIGIGELSFPTVILRHSRQLSQFVTSQLSIPTVIFSNSRQMTALWNKHMFYFSWNFRHMSFYRLIMLPWFSSFMTLYVWRTYIDCLFACVCIGFYIYEVWLAYNFPLCFYCRRDGVWILGCWRRKVACTHITMK